MKKHFTDKSRIARAGINFIWFSLFTAVGDPTGVKFRIFECVALATVCYDAQYWAPCTFSEIEKVKRFFLKKRFKLPMNSPNYIVYNETNRQLVPINTEAEC
ncbi:hypothetical protein GE061_004327 [Apolygus lucorum]|uniref:Uncharacterized protein n=1 Tax=Apolygus lucorum TaxID=248454 RepID=A0A8S9X0S3_APOLU|nr:hypothetical protein GE061_004327 [Apolygus lucorum]